MKNMHIELSTKQKNNTVKMDSECNNDTYTRQCNGCTECCRGWLHGEAYGKIFERGRPCHFVGEKGCTIYCKRPKDPCVSFKCGWLTDSDTFPEWMKPNLVKIIAKSMKTKNGIDYYEITECGQKIDASVLNYLILHALNNGVNMKIQVGGTWTNYGTEEFTDDVE